MKTIGIVAEYNPFHSGHAYHIQASRWLFQEETAIVAVMSGNWVQRGECAITDKWTRTEMALRGGVDLVLELPTVWAVASAEGFARGTMAILEAAGVVDVLSFGSETGEITPLLELARCLNSPVFSLVLRQELGPKKSFAQCRRSAVERLLGPGRAALLDTPNNNLGVEYLRFLPNGMEAVTIARQGAVHDGETAGTHASASLLRRWLRAGEVSRAFPFQSLPWKGEAADMAWCERALIARLRTMTLEEAEALPGGGDGLAARLLCAARQTAKLEELYSLTKTRTYAHARVRRLALCALLGIHKEDVPAAPPYIRVLGFNERGQELLREMNTRASLPFFVKPAHNRRLSPQAQALFALEERFTDLFGLCFPTPRPGGLEWTRNPVVIRKHKN
ncbi:nucleotidyltransferase [Pseudoflavonifractor sp. 60]|uniref:tRNA(Met) cytidine acetate ligase n=1 Tax=Pseudoflavonifractor sp. 60 TaxID=2304576 RepID=UPI00136D7A64|nr:nucleotidyltransferase family protein [Pseudoflavonifractor sp. 60]MCI8871132.1 nucleotidyltransferase family protein [Lawsonibacter sp.]NBI65222.1 nucleotidyltransferase [Pseudoflavonifractor sp. 60]